MGTLNELDEPFSEDLEEAPPLPGKTHPHHELADVVPTLDDERRSYPKPPDDPTPVEFRADPDVADAAADLASDLGAEFVEGATRVEDLSEVASSYEDDSEEDASFHIEEEPVEGTEEEPEEGEPAAAEAPPSEQRRRQASR